MEEEPAGTVVIEVRAEYHGLPEEGGKKQQNRQIDITRFTLKFVIVIFYFSHGNVWFSCSVLRSSEI